MLRVLCEHVRVSLPPATICVDCEPIWDGRIFGRAAVDRNRPRYAPYGENARSLGQQIGLIQLLPLLAVCDGVLSVHPIIVA